MKFIEMTGKQLTKIIQEDELHINDLKGAGIHDQTIVRINQQGDIEIRRQRGWDVVGGLLGGFEDRVKACTGLEWA